MSGIRKAGEAARARRNLGELGGAKVENLPLFGVCMLVRERERLKNSLSLVSPSKSLL